jgi:hypothetical protein
MVLKSVAFVVTSFLSGISVGVAECSGCLYGADYFIDPNGPNQMAWTWIQMADGECRAEAGPTDPVCTQWLGCVFGFSFAFINNTPNVHTAWQTDPYGGQTPITLPPGTTFTGYRHHDVPCGGEWNIVVSTGEYWRCLCTKCATY